MMLACHSEVTADDTEVMIYAICCSYSKLIWAYAFLAPRPTTTPFYLQENK